MKTLNSSRHFANKRLDDSISVVAHSALNDAVNRLSCLDNICKYIEKAIRSNAIPAGLDILQCKVFKRGKELCWSVKISGATKEIVVSNGVIANMVQ